MTTPYDAAWKLLFSFPAMPLDLLTGFIPSEWIANLDLSAPQSEHPEAGPKHRPGNLLSNGLLQRHSDMIWEIRFRDRPDDRESPHGEAPANGSSEPLPSVLPIVLYHGKTRWQAKEDVAGLCATPADGLAPYQPAQRYFLLDLDHFPGPLPEGRNLMAILVRLVQSRSLEQEAAVVDELIEWLHEESAPEGLVRAFWAWMGYAHVPEWRQRMDWPVLKDWREAGTVLRESVNEWTTKWMAQGRTEVMRHQAARKFGAETAERLAGHLEEITDPERAVEIGEWLLECDSDEELLARVERLCESSATGNGAPPN